MKHGLPVKRIFIDPMKTAIYKAKIFQIIFSHFNNY